MLANVLTKTVLDRWRGVVIGSFSLGLMLLFGMSVYRDIDLAIYTNLPEVVRSFMNIPADADVGALAYGAIYSSYGALTLASLALSMGSASMAGEERSGTLGLLLGNPKSRTTVLMSKAATMVILIGLGAFVLWAAGVFVPRLLDVSITGMHVGALAFHMFSIALFHGFLAMAIGAWTGRNGLATGVTVAVMVLSFVAVGLLPLISGWEDAARIFPWYYYDTGQPVLNGVDWGGLSVLMGGVAVFASLALAGINRRDIRDRAADGGIVERLRSHPLTQRVVNRLAGSTRVSRIWIKTASEHQGLLIITAYVMFLVMGVLMGPMYTFIDDTLKSFSENFPDAILALAGGGDVTTAEGWYRLETFGLMAPTAVMVATVTIGARALAGEEASRTIGLLLANPIKRSTVILEKTIAMAVYAAAVGFATWAGVTVGSLIAGLGMSTANIAATSLLVTILGFAFGALALALSAATGRTKIAIYITVAAALGLHLFNAFVPLSTSLAGYARLSPFYYYLTSDPLMNGMNWGHGAVLAGLAGLLIWVAILLFDRRDLRQTG